LNLAILSLAAILITISLSAILSRTQKPAKASVPPKLTAAGKVIQVQVVNRSGVPGAAMQVTEYLRIQGYDVVEIATERGQPLVRSYVADRCGDSVRAAQLVKVLFIDSGHVRLDRPSNAYVDFTVFVGRDLAKSVPAN